MKKLIFATDLHVGWERKGGHKRPIHDEKAWNAVLAFTQHFKPDVFIFGGDILDCGPISHHNRAAGRRKTEGFRLVRDAGVCRELAIDPIKKLVRGDIGYITGNHEDWLEDLIDHEPELEGAFSLKSLLGLDGKVKLVDQGGHIKVGKITFVHGDQVSGGEHVAKSAVTTYDEENIVFGHFHTYQQHTKTSPISNKLPRTGTAVPCLCTKDPAYNEGKPNRWAQGFYYAYLMDDGTFSAYVPIIINGRFAAEGRVFKG